MKLIVDGTSYDVHEALQQAALGDLLQLKVKTKTPDFAGVTIKFISTVFTEMGEKFEHIQDEGDANEVYLELLGDEGFLSAMMGVIFLSKRQAGEQVGYADVERTPFTSFRFEPDEGEVEAAPKESGADGDPLLV